MKRLILFSFVLLISLQLPAQSSHRFEITGGEFRYDGRPFQIRSGEMHYARIPREHWRHRLKMIRALGLNTVATYVFWNYHHPEPGVWDFESGNHDLRGFIRTAAEEGLLVILRPGPYACAEWEFGGYPWWLQTVPSLVIRTENRPFLDSCKQYLDRLADQVRDLQVTAGGPVIMIQAENEFGSYVAQRKDLPRAQHDRYKRSILEMLRATGLQVPFFTSDGSWLFDEGSVPGVLPTANGEDDVANLKKMVNQYHGGQGPYMVAEYYPGWLHHWGEKFPNVPADAVVVQLEKFLKEKISFNIYMVHGGTNFGFTSGANYDDEHDIQPDMTSYDYDAPVSEPGWVTPKYLAIRALMARYCDSTLPAIPERPKVITIPAIRFTRSADLLSLISAIKPVRASAPLSFEQLGQGHGYVFYRVRVAQATRDTLRVEGLRDQAVVLVNGVRQGILDRMSKRYSLPVDLPANATLDLLVENMGRINYGAEIVHNLKGIISPVKLGDHELSGTWEMLRLPFDRAPSVSGKMVIQKKGRPAIYQATFDLRETGDSFLDLSSWGKGIVFVNGHNLGRYWNIGPQQTLYLPAEFLRKGRNSIVVFEQLNDLDEPSIPGLAEPELHRNR